mmetsp:Transcript_21357/g.30575  ORF Transcript_21357/g.30575 Transcript_21357/m.30575 type:complete len:210 (+) Transcript_21357:6582-7211(+)
MFNYSWTPGEIDLLHHVDKLTSPPHHSYVASGSSALSSIPEEREYIQSIAASMDSSKNIYRTRPPRFPLHEIGALHAISRPWEASHISPIGGDDATECSPERSLLLVYGESRGDSNTDPWFPLWQPSFSTGSVGSGTSLSRGPTEHGYLDVYTTHRLVRHAHHWLLTYGGGPRWPELSPSIYWAVRSLRTYFAAALEQQKRGGPSHWRR